MSRPIIIIAKICRKISLYMDDRTVVWIKWHPVDSAGPDLPYFGIFVSAKSVTVIHHAHDRELNSDTTYPIKRHATSCQVSKSHCLNLLVLPSPLISSSVLL